MVGNGVVDVLSGGTADVRFLSNASGGLEIADIQGAASAFTGAVSGFGGANHANHVQFIDLVSVTSAPHTISFSYTSGVGSGTLTVSSGGAVVASIELVGNYSSGNFHVTAGSNGTVKITDPGVVNGGSVEPGVTDIALGAQTALAYSELSPAMGLGATGGRYAAAIALLGNYMAGSFATTAGGHGGKLISGTPPVDQQSLLTQPHHG
jgi:hypothetical protein